MPASQPARRTNSVPILFKQFEYWLEKERGLSPNTRRQYSVEASLTDRELRKRGTTILECSDRELRHVLWERPHGPKSRNAYRAALMAFYAFAAFDNLRSDNPAAGIPKVKEQRSLPRPISNEWLPRYVKAARDLGPRAHLLALLGLYAGLRISEAAGLTWERVEASELVVIGKGSRERRIPIAPPLQTALAAWRMECPSPEWVFPSRWGPRTGNPLCRQNAHKIHREVCRNAELPVFNFHRLRHTFGTEALRKSKDLRAVQELMGHSSPATTAIYTLVDGTRLSGVVGALYEDETSPD